MRDPQLLSVTRRSVYILCVVKDSNLQELVSETSVFTIFTNDAIRSTLPVQGSLRSEATLPHHQRSSAA